MKEPFGRSSQLPAELFRAVVAAAHDLGRDVAGDDLFFLGLFDLPEGTAARAALETQGLSRERVAESIRTAGDHASDEPGGIRFPPSLNEVHGRADGFAAALGDGGITPEHVLLSLIWNPTSQTSQLLWRFGVQREWILDSLRDSGVPIPLVAIPEQREVDVGERVWFDRDHLSRVIDLVREHVAPGTAWGFNYEDGRVWVRAEISVDVQAVVDEAVAGH